MTLTVISNFAANVSHRNLVQTDMETTRSIAQLSSGKRVQSARDDAASLAIGSRLRAEVAALQAARVNAGQASSMLQIADGAMSQIDNILVRMKTLSIQSGSSQFGSVERSLIDAEFQQLLLEIDRIAKDTEFNGANLLDGGDLTRLVKASNPGLSGISQIKLDSSVKDESVFQYSYNATGEVLTITKTAVDGKTVNTATDILTGQQTGNNLSLTLDSSVNADDVFTYSYDKDTEQFTVTNQRTGEAATVDITDSFNAAFGSSKNVLTAGQKLDVDFSSLGVTLTLDDGFDRTNPLSDSLATGVTSGANLTLANNSYAHATGVTSKAIDNVLKALGNNYDASTGVVTIAATASNTNNNTIITGIAGIDFGSGVGNDHTVADGTGAKITIKDANGQAIGTITSDFTATGDGATTLNLDLGGLVRNVQTNSSGTDETVNIDLTDEIDAVAGKGNNLSFDQTVSVSVAQFGIDLTLDKGFDRTNNIVTTTGRVTETSASLANGSFAANAGFLNADTYDALLALGYDSTTGVGYNANTGILSLKVEDVGSQVRLNGLAGIRYNSGVAGENSADYAGTTGKTTDISVTTASGKQVSLGVLTGDYTDGTDGTGLVNIQLGAGVFYNSVDENSAKSDFTFKIGTGNRASDNIVLSFDSVNADALGLRGAGVTTKETSDSASKAISSAVTNLNRARANIGALQNRLGVASSNLSVSIENTEAARSQLLDLDVAKGITEFTAKQILLQAGVSTLSRANQLPQNLLQLFQ